ncbi:MAG: aldehyde dehydrogenase family protein [Deltaproteobacteria bacterium]|nr:aldehyde dehydrogenase family protein [Deltaproteobacteria bacterium]
MALVGTKQSDDAGCIESYDPATLEKIGQVSAWSEADVDRAADRGRAAQEVWAATPIKERARCLLKARDYLVDNTDRISELISRENGKPRVESLINDVFTVIYGIDYYAKYAAKFLADEPVGIRWWRLVRRKSYLNRLPRGLVAIISPWNYPFSIPAGEVAMALMAGTAVLLKPARATCLTGEALGEVFNAAGLPDGLLQVVHGSGAAVLKQKLDFIAFTGSVDVGKKVMARAAATLTPVMLELGGKDPMIVCHDANLEVAAAAAVWGAFSNGGQACASVERVYVHEAVAAAFIAKVVDKTRKLRQGHGVRLDVDVGAMCTEEQLGIVKAQMERARAQGAKFLTGGSTNPEAGPGYFYKPTVLTNVGQDWECVQQETFGPTMPILTFKDEADVIRRANDNLYGLTAAVFTKNIRRGEALARKLIAGTVYVNDAIATHGFAETPWGGFKDTGIGRTHGKYGLLDFTGIRHVHINRLSGMKNPWFFGYSEAGYRAFKNTGLMLRSGLGHKLRGAAGAVAALRATYKGHI